MVKQYEVVILPEAQEDIRSIVLYIATDLQAVDAALGLEEAFQQAIRSLNKMPERYQAVDEEPWHSANVRRMVVENFYVYYWVLKSEPKVEVLTVMYIARDQREQLERTLKHRGLGRV